MHCTTLHHTAPHCNTLQHTATHCNTLQHTATHCHKLHHTAPHCTTLQHTATHCNKLQHNHLCTHAGRECHTEKSSSALRTPSCTLQRTAHTAIHRNTLQHTATHCNTLQHTATHLNPTVSTHTQGEGGTLKQQAALSEHLQAHCNALHTPQYTALHCNTLQHTVSHCNILYHTAPHLNTTDSTHTQGERVTLKQRAALSEHLQAQITQLQSEATRAHQNQALAHTRANEARHSATSLQHELEVCCSVCCSVLQCVVVCVLQYVCCSMCVAAFARTCAHLSRAALQHTHCNALQHTCVLQRSRAHARMRRARHSTTSLLHELGMYCSVL